jgi:hypothetical protein
MYTYARVVEVVAEQDASIDRGARCELPHALCYLDLSR